MKILFILHFPPPIHGSSLVGGFIKDSRLINEHFNCRYINLGTSVSVEEIGKNHARKVLRYFRLIWRVKKELIFNKPVLCYLTINSKGAGFYKDALIVLLIRLFGVKRVYHFHNKGVGIRQGKFLDNLLYRIVFWNANVILLSKYLYPDIQKYVPEARVYYCPNGIPDIKDKRQKSQVDERSEEMPQGGDKNEEVLKNVEPRAESIEKDDVETRPLAPSPPRSLALSGIVEILFLSHLIESKGVLVLINACGLLQDRGLEFHCTIAGGDAELTKQDVETIVAEKGLSSLISVVGQKHGEEKAELMRSADIFVHPSYNDCLPLVLLEAMQHSLPVVSTPEGAIPDVVDDGVTGFLVPQRDVVALADKLEVLIKDPGLRVKMGAAGRAKYEREFTLDRFEKRMVEILKEVGSD